MSATNTITKQGFEIVVKGLELYNKVLDQTVPWKSIEQSVKASNLYSEHHSIESSVIIGEIQAKASNAIDDYFLARQFIYEWCSLTTVLVASYETLFKKQDKSNFPAQKQVLLKVLDVGMAKMSMAHVKLEGVSSNFSLVTEKLTDLLARLTIEFDNKSEYIKSVNRKIRRAGYGTAGVGVVLGPFGLVFSQTVAANIVEGRIVPEMQMKFDEIKNFYASLKVQIETSNADIKSAKRTLDADIQTVQSGPSSAFDDMNRLHDDIIGTVNNLIVQCEEFKRKK